MQEQKVKCETPTPGKKPTNVPKWKYDAVRKAILKSVPKHGEGVLFKDLPAIVNDLLSREDKARLGSVSWHTTCVKLDMEVKGDIKRVPGSSPQRLLRV